MREEAEPPDASGFEQRIRIPDAAFEGTVKQRVHLSRQASFEAWVGRREKLLRLAAEVERGLEGAYNSLSSELSEDDSFQRRLMADALRPRVEVTAGKGRLTRSGDLAQILDEMDLGEIETVSIGNGDSYRHRYRSKVRSEYPEIQLDLGYTDDFRSFMRSEKPIRLTVAGPDRQWVGGTFDLLGEELRKGVPWWAVLRSQLVAVVMANAFFLGIIAWMIVGTGGKAIEPDPSVSPVMYVGLMVVMVLGTSVLLGPIVVKPLLERAFPAVEVVEPGVPARGRKFLAGLVGVLTFGMSIFGLIMAAASTR